MCIPPMRFAAALLALVAPALASHPASACPATVATDVTTDDLPATSSPCMDRVDFSHVHRSLELSYVVGAGGTSQSGVGKAATAFAGLELAYGLQFGGDDTQPSYEVELTGGAAGSRSAGDVNATGLVTRAGARIGPAQMHASVIDEGRGNIAFFPMTMELAHVGELAARPRLSARPELARSLYGRERVELSTRVVRVEGAGEQAQAGAPGATAPKKPISWVVDAIPLHAGVDIAMQDTTRFETTIRGSMLAVAEHTSGVAVDMFGIEHRRIDFPMADATDLDTLWMLRIDGVDPYTGSQYYVGWGEVLAMPDKGELVELIDPENKRISIGGVGWYSHHRWGGFGAQYKREPFVTMTGAVALEDRVSGEVYVPRALGLVASVFGARTTRLVENELRHASTAGVELAASYARDGFSSKLSLDLGRTFYAALDGLAPETTGFAANVGLTVQHSGSRTWRR